MISWSVVIEKKDDPGCIGLFNQSQFNSLYNSRH